MNTKTAITAIAADTAKVEAGATAIAGKGVRAKGSNKTNNSDENSTKGEGKKKACASVKVRAA